MAARPGSRGARRPAGPDGPEFLSCASCHSPDPAGMYMAPVSMALHCQRCHPLTFEDWAEERTLPHGDVAQVFSATADFYRGAALDPALEIPGRPSWQRRPQQPRPSEREDAPDRWAEEQIAASHTVAFGEAACGNCHAVVASEDRWTVQAAGLTIPRWSGARFDHGAHQTQSCTDCHDASGSEALDAALMPALAQCQQCHGGEDDASRTRSTCVMCHPYHRADQPAM